VVYDDDNDDDKEAERLADVEAGPEIEDQERANIERFDAEYMLRLDQEVLALGLLRSPHNFLTLTESPSDGSTSSPWASLVTPDSPAFTPPSVLTRRKIRSGRTKAKRLDFERAVNTQEGMPPIFNEEPEVTPTKKRKAQLRTTSQATKMKKIAPAKAPVTRAAARKSKPLAPTLQSVVDLSNLSSEGDNNDEGESEIEIDIDMET
jgi:hypothetical protein